MSSLTSITKAYTISVVISLFARLLILFLRQPYFFGGDLYTYAVFAHEIRDNSFLIPMTNSLHYPGSGWIFPPLVPYIAALMDTGGTQTFLYSLTALEILVSSLTAIPIVKFTEKLFGSKTAMISGILYATFPGFVYLCLWGDLAQIMALFFFAVLLNTLHSTVTTGSRRSALYGALLTAIIGLTHDLTFFITVLFEIVLLLYIAVSSTRKESRVPRSISSLSITLFAGSVIGSIWYVIHIEWLKGLFNPGYLSQTGSIVLALNSFETALSTELAVPYGYYYSSLTIFVLLIMTVAYVD